MNFVQQGLRRRLCMYIGDSETRTVDHTGEQRRQLLSSGAKSRKSEPSGSANGMFWRLQREMGTVVKRIVMMHLRMRKISRGSKRRRSLEQSYQESSFQNEEITFQEPLSESDTDMEEEWGKYNETRHKR